MPEEMKLDDLEDDGLGDLVEDFQQADAAVVEPESPEQTAPESQQPEGQQANAQAPEEAQEPEPETEPEGQGEPEPEPEQTFKYRGKEYSFEDLRKDPDLFTKVITGANQQSHYQELYEKQKQEAEELTRRVQQEAYERQQQVLYEQRLAAQRQQQQQAQQQGGGFTPDILKGHYGRQLDGMVKEGWIEEDVKELYPNVATGMLYLRDTLLNEVAMLKQQVAGLMGYTQQQYSEATKSHVRNTINGIFNEIAAEGGIFEPLKDRQTRNEFIRELQSTVNPEIKAIIENPNILRNLWVARNHQTILKAAEQQRAAAQTVATQKRRLSAAEAPGTKASPARPQKKPTPGEEEGWADL